MTNTPHAYERLIADETDIVFVAGPSDAQGKTAATAGKTFKLTPIGKEAFVFFCQPAKFHQQPDHRTSSTNLFGQTEKLARNKRRRQAHSSVPAQRKFRQPNRYAENHG